MGRFLHALVAIAVVVPAVAVSTASARTTAKPPPPLLAFSFAGTPTMLVDATGEEGNDGPPAAFAGNPNRFQPPSKVAIRVPAGFPIATGAVGSTLGRVEALASEEDPARSLDSYLLLEGPVTMADPALYPPGSAASACDPQPHTAVWLAALTTLGLDLDIPIFVDPQTGSAGGEQLVFCAPVPRTTDGTATRLAPLAIGILAFWSLLEPPASATPYVLSAEITPLGPDLQTPAPSQTVEVRAVLPARLTLTGPKTAKTYQVTLHGRLTAGGRPLAGVFVDVQNLRPSDPAAGFATGRTDRSGRFSATLPITHTTRFVAGADLPLVTRCHGASTAPAGCVSTTVPRATGGTWTVRVTS